MKKYTITLSGALLFLVVAFPVYARTYTKLELLTAVLNSTYQGTGNYTAQSCDPATEKPTAEVSFDDIDTAGTVVSATIYDGAITYTVDGTLKKKSGNSFYTLKLDGGYTSDTADYTVTLKGRVTSTKPSIIRKAKISATAELIADSSVHCEASMAFKKLIAE